MCEDYAYDHFGRYAYLMIDTSIQKDLPRRFPIAARCFPFKNLDDEMTHLPVYFRWRPPPAK